MGNSDWCSVRDALTSIAQLLRQLKPPVMSTTHAGPSSGNPERFHITLDVHTDRDLQPDEKQLVIDQARPIIETALQTRGYALTTLATFTYGVMYANAERNMNAVGRSLESVLTRLRTLHPSILSTYHIGPFSGEPDGFTTFLSVESMDELEPAVKSQLIADTKALVGRELRSQGYHHEAVDSFSYVIVRQVDIDKAGDWYSLLR